MDLQATRQFAEAVAREAGTILLDHFGKVAVEYKGRYDVVTEADKASETHVMARITGLYPDHHLVGEEGGGSGAPLERAEYVWYVDPLDGTANFASGIPHFNVSIAMADANAKPLVGVVYDPLRDVLFSAVAGGGAIRDGETISVSNTQLLDDAMVITGFPRKNEAGTDDFIRQWEYFLRSTRGLRRFGAAALDMCWVADGRCDGFWETHLNRWDFMAGLLIVREAGGIVSDFSGKDSDALYTDGECLATNPHLHPQMTMLMKNAR